MTGAIPTFGATLTSPTAITVTFSDSMTGTTLPGQWIVDLTPSTFPGGLGDTASHIVPSGATLAIGGASLAITLGATSALPADATPVVRYPRRRRHATHVEPLIECRRAARPD